MSFIPTNSAQIQRFGNALYGVQVGSTTMAQVTADIAAVGSLYSVLNSYYIASFGTQSTTVVANTMLTNLGIVAGTNGLVAANVTEARDYIVAQLNAASPATRGETVAVLLNLWGNLAGDTTYGAAATAWNATIDGAIAYTGTANVASGTTSSTTGQTFTLTTGMDEFIGGAGNDTFKAFDDNWGTNDVTLNVGDEIDGGAGIDTLQIIANTDWVSLSGVGVTNVEHLVIKPILQDWWISADVELDGIAFDSVTIDFGNRKQFEDNDAEYYIEGIAGQTDLTVTNVAFAEYDEYLWIGRNYNAEAFSTDAGAVSVTNTFSNINLRDNSGDEDDNGIYYDGYNNFSNATSITHQLNLTNFSEANTDTSTNDDDNYFYEYIELSAKNAQINTTINVTNVEGNYTFVGVYIENGATVATADVVTATVNVTNSDNIDVYVDSYYNGESSDSDAIVFNLDGLTNSDNESYLGSSGFESFTINVASASVVEGVYDDDTVVGNQQITIAAAADFTVKNSFNFDGVVEDVTVTVTGAGNVDLGNADLGDGTLGDVVTVDASAMTGDFSIFDSTGYATTITSGSGKDTIKLGSYTTTVSTGNGDDTVNTNDHDYGDALAMTIDGGAGRNTIVISEGTFLDAGFAANISNFQVLGITGAAGGDTFDMSVESSLTAVAGKGNLDAVVINKAAAGTTVSLATRDNENNTATSLTYALKTSTGESDNFSLSLRANDIGVEQGSVNALTVSTVIANAIETFSISSNATTTDGSADGKTLYTAKDYTNIISSLEGDAVKTLTLTGAASLTISSVTAATLTSVNASAMTGNVTSTFSSSLASYTGGAGDDTLSLVAGDLKQGNTFAGGAGTKDSLTVVATANQDMGIVGLTDFETLNFTTSGANVGDFRNVTGLTTVKIAVNASGDDLTLNRLSAGTTLSFGASIDQVVTTLNIGTSQKVAFHAAATVTNITLDSGTTSLTVTSDDGDLNVDEAMGVFTDIDGTSLASITVLGADRTNLGTLKATVTSVVASAATGGLTVTASATATTILGGTAADTITGGAGADTITGGAGADVLSGLGGKDTITGGAGADDITGGAKADVINLTETVAATDTVNIAAGDSVLGTVEIPGYDVITGFAAIGTDGDILKIANAATAVSLAATDVTGLTSETEVSTLTASTSSAGILTLTGSTADKANVNTLAEWVAIAEAVSGAVNITSDTTVYHTMAFEFGGSTYVFQSKTVDAGGSETFTTEAVVQLVGVTGVVGISGTAGTNVIDFV